MDPYIERPAIWADFHDSLITYIKAALQPLLRPRYVAISQERLYVVDSKRPIYPDVSVLQTSTRPMHTTPSAVLELDAPVVFTLEREEVREPLLAIIEPTADKRIITAIEVLSPDNKTTGPGRVSYLKKRDEFWNSATNIVEIDLLRAGEPPVPPSAEQLPRLGSWHYLITVTRCLDSVAQVYPRTLKQRLPHFAVPLGAGDKDVPLDLQAVFTRCWDDGPYPELLLYDGPPPGQLTPEEISWCESVLRQHDFRPTNGQ
jgi:hypothetical protein